MRKLLVLCVAFLPAFAAAAVAGTPGDGTLSVRDGRGMVQLSSRGTMIGRIERGRLVVTDPNPFDNRRPIVLGAESKSKSKNLKTTTYRGTDMRLRVNGGLVHVKFEGRGIQLSAVGRGRGLIEGAGDPGISNDGVWSLNDEEDRSLPDVMTGFQLVGPPPEG